MHASISFSLFLCLFSFGAQAESFTLLLKPSVEHRAFAKSSPSDFVRSLSDDDSALTFERTLALDWIMAKSEYKTPALLLEKIRKSPQIEDAEINAQRRAHRVPSDTRFNAQWNLQTVRAPGAWDLATGSAMRIGIADTGAPDGHEDAPLDESGYDFVTDPENDNDDEEGRDADYREADIACSIEEYDAGYHGAHVAGIAGARTDNGTGIAGLSFNAAIVHARVLDACSTGSDADILEGMAWLAGIDVPGVPAIEAPVDVINASLGGEGSCNSIYLDFMDAIDQRGVLVTASSGNEGNAFLVESPANCPSVISVGAEGPSGLAYYSNIDDTLNIIAPGGDQSLSDDEGVLSLCGFEGDCYINLEGTSMAAPHVAAAIALVRSIAPAASRREILFGMQMSGRACQNCRGIPALDVQALLALFDGGGPEVPPGLGEGSCSLEFVCASGQECLVFDEGTACFLICENEADCDVDDECTEFDFGAEGVESYCVRCTEDCDEALPDAGVIIDDGGSSRDDGIDTEDPDEGCAQTRPLNLAWLALILWVFRRRRPRQG